MKVKNIHPDQQPISVSDITSQQSYIEYNETVEYYETDEVIKSAEVGAIKHLLDAGYIEEVGVTKNYLLDGVDVEDVQGLADDIESVTGDLATHEIATTGIHGVGGSTIDSVTDRDSAISTHNGLSTGVHGVGASTVETVAGSQSKVDIHNGLSSGVHGAIGTVAEISDIAVDGNLSVAGQDAITKRHSQNTDQYLDFGGGNQVAVADAKDAVTKKHTQDTDQYLDFGGGNQSTAADVKDAVTKKHGVNDVNTSAEPSGTVATHAALTATHGVAGTIASIADISTHSGLTTGVHGVVGTVAEVSDIAVDANLSVAAQAVVTAGACDVDANLSVTAQASITASHAQYSDLTKIITYLSAASVGGTGATETLVVTGLAVADTVLSVVNSVAGGTPANDVVIAWSVLGADSLSVTWIGDPGAGAKVTVAVKKA